MTTARDRVLVRTHDRARVSLALLTGEASADPPPRWSAPFLAGVVGAVVLVVVTSVWPQSARPQRRPTAPAAHAAGHHHRVHRKGRI